MFPGILIAFLTTLSWSIGIFPFTQAARRLGSNTLNHFRLLLALIFLSITSVIILQTSPINLFTIPSIDAWLWLGLSGIIGLALGDQFAFLMFAILGARTGSIFTCFAPATALILSSILLDEHINAIGIAGMIITIAGVIAISMSRSERERIPDHGHGSIAKGILLGILSAVCQGAGLVLAKKGFNAEELIHHTLTPVHATWMRMLAATVSIFLYTFLFGKVRDVIQPIRENRNKGIVPAILGTVFGPFVGVSLSLLTINLIEVSVAQTIFSLIPIFALFIAAIFLKEKISWRAVIGALVAISGVVVLIWREEINLWLSKIFCQ